MSERSAVQQPMIEYASEIGWQYLKPEQALQLRGGEKDPLCQEAQAGKEEAR